ncbi:hypothetical protein ES707_12808 [subsurface metagenome]
MLMHFGRALPFVGHEPARRGTYVEHPADHLLVGGRLAGSQMLAQSKRTRLDVGH